MGGQPSFYIVLRREREGWGTLLHIPPFAEDAKDGAPAPEKFEGAEAHVRTRRQSPHPVSGRRTARRAHQGDRRGRRRQQRGQPHDRGGRGGRCVHRRQHRRAGAAAPNAPIKLQLGGAADQRPGRGREPRHRTARGAGRLGQDHRGAGGRGHGLRHRGAGRRHGNRRAAPVIAPRPARWAC